MLLSLFPLVDDGSRPRWVWGEELWVFPDGVKDLVLERLGRRGPVLELVLEELVEEVDGVCVLRQVGVGKVGQLCKGAAAGGDVGGGLEERCRKVGCHGRGVGVEKGLVVGGAQPLSDGNHLGLVGVVLCLDEVVSLEEDHAEDAAEGPHVDGIVV